MRKLTFLASTALLLVAACQGKDQTSPAELGDQGGGTGSSSAPITLAQAHEALDESTADSQAASLTTSSIEVSTNFTIGKGVAAAVAELQTFLGDTLPCADVTLAGATLTVKYGAKSGSCTYKGHTFSGTHAITLSQNDMAQVIVDDTWTDLSNGIVKVSGTAHVTWDFSNVSRRVQHDLTWTRLSDGKTGEGTGDRTQKPLADGLSEGIQVDGSRTWTGPAGKWSLAIEGVQMRWADPLPQAGTYELTTPAAQSVSLSFRRVDDKTIACTLASGGHSFSFDVAEAGQVTEQP
jgi:hypothetical protein